MKLKLGILLLLSTALSVNAQTSENNVRLKKALERFPQADKNKDGILTAEEARLFKEKMQNGQESKSGKKGNRENPDSGNFKGMSYSVDPTKKDVSYGPYDRNILDFWQAKVSSPAPVIVYIHGGGFSSGDKLKASKTKIIEKSLRKGYHFASINYRYAYKTVEDVNDKQKTGQAGSFRDGARAIQFLKYKANEWKIDKERIIIVGSSAGGGICGYIAMWDDLADPGSSDPVLRESSRVFAWGHIYSQSTYDLTKWPKILNLSESFLKKMGGSHKKAGMPLHIKLGLNSESDLNTEKGKMYKKMVDLVSYASSDDPPIFIYNKGKDGDPKSHGHMVHHPRFSMHLAEVAKENDIEVKLVLPKINGTGEMDQYQAFLNWVDSLL